VALRHADSFAMPRSPKSPIHPDLDPVPRRMGFGTALSRIATHFTLEGALGMIAVDASGFEGIERSYGGDAFECAMNNLGALITDLIGDRLGIDDMVVAGETGRSEMLVLLFREPDEVEFYKRELPDLRRILQDGIVRRGDRVAYPHMKVAPRLHVGMSASLRNPTIGAENQIRAALEEARADALLDARLEQRAKRRQLFELVIEGQIRSVYEPIVEVNTRTVYGYEALARGPEGTELYSPMALFAMATEQDLLFQLDCLCRKSGLVGARDLPSGTKLFLNVRPTTIHDPNFRADALCRTLERHQLEPRDVVFEISEQESIGNFSIFREVRDYYGKLGFQIALDDTGAGYQSLEAVLQLSPEFIKMDRSFVQGIDQDSGKQELLRALQSVAEHIGARIIGEGLDTLAELETLGKLGIPFGQGWLFGKPQPLSAGL